MHAPFVMESPLLDEEMNADGDLWRIKGILKIWTIYWRINNNKEMKYKVGKEGTHSCYGHQAFRENRKQIFEGEEPPPQKKI